MIGIIFYVTAAFGLAFIVGRARISDPIRAALAGNEGGRFSAARVLFVHLLECEACFGFWTGIVASLIGVVPLDVPGNVIISTIMWGTFTAGSNLVVSKIMD